MDAVEKLASALALCKAYEVAHDEACRHCGLPATRCDDGYYGYYACDACQPKDGKGVRIELNDRTCAPAVRRLMRLVKGEH